MKNVQVAKHIKIAQELNCKTYFTKLCHSWERGQNENANVLLRQYFPKGMELISVAIDEVLLKATT